MRTCQNLVTLLLVVIAIGCGDSPSPVAPTPTATLTVLTITPQTTLMLVGRSQRFVANAVYSDGASRGVTPSWTVTPADIGTIDANGTFAARRMGTATVAATFESRTASLTLRVLVDYSGDWEGVARITECSGRLPQSCDELQYSGTERMTTIWMDQSDAHVRAFLYINQTGELFIEGTIGDDGSLVLAGERLSRPPLPSYVELRITNWNTRIDGAGALVGGFTLVSQESPAPDINNPSKRRVYTLLDVRHTRVGRTNVSETVENIRAVLRLP